MQLAALADVPPYLLRSHRQHLMFSKLHRSTVRINMELVLEIHWDARFGPEKVHAAGNLCFARVVHQECHFPACLLYLISSDS